MGLRGWEQLQVTGEQFLKKSKGAWTTASTSSSPVLEKNRSSAVLADNSAALSLGPAPRGLLFQQVVAGGPWGFGWKKGVGRDWIVQGKSRTWIPYSLLPKREHLQECKGALWITTPGWQIQTGTCQGKPGWTLPYLSPLPSCVDLGNYITSLNCGFCIKKANMCLPPGAVGRD